jgi:dynein heavy chain
LDEVDIPNSMRESIVKHMVMVHTTVSSQSIEFKQKLRRHNYVTPKNFLDFIMNYRDSLASCRKNNSDMSARLSGGLGKLIQAKQEVAEMQVCASTFWHQV